MLCKRGIGGCNVGSNESSSLMEETLVAHGTPLLQDCFVLRIEDDLECTDVSQYKTARMFRQCFPAKTLPTVVLIRCSVSMRVNWQGECI